MNERERTDAKQAAFEEPASGFAQSEDVVVSVFIPYCESGAEWEVVIDGDAPERCPDLVPLPATEADAAKVCVGVLFAGVLCVRDVCVVCVGVCGSANRVVRTNRSAERVVESITISGGDQGSLGGEGFAQED